MPDIAAASNLSHAQLGYEVGIAVAKKAMDNARQQGAAAISLLEQAAEIQKQAVSTASVNGVGGKLDLQG